MIPVEKAVKEWEEKSVAEKNEWLEESLKKNYPEIWSIPVKKKRFFSK